MRILFVPYYQGIVSHGLPLLSLCRRCQAHGFDTAFLLKGDVQPAARRALIDVVDVDHQGTPETERAAYDRYRPDVVVDDTSLSTAYAAPAAGLPRVAIVRTGTFPGTAARTGHSHSLPFTDERWLKPHRHISELFEAAMYVVPGIASIERLPESHRQDDRYVFSGPLLLPDREIEALIAPPGTLDRVRPVLEQFLDRHHDRPKVCFTFGTVAQPPLELLHAVRALLSQGLALISTVELPDMTGVDAEACLVSPFLPMHDVCEACDLVIHHCGSATYHYPLLHGVPAITVGTQTEDRDGVAERLQALGASVHVAHPAECPGFGERFAGAVDAALRQVDRLSYRAAVAPLRQEIERTAAAFDFAAVLRAALRSRPHSAEPVFD